MAASALRIGLVGLDTSHSVAFTKCLNKADDPEHVEGGRVVAAFAGGSPDFELSISRVPGFSKTLTEDYGVRLMDSPGAVAEAVDLVMLISCDGRVHRRQFEDIAKFKRPTFIDKPLATTTSEARAIFELAGKSGIAVMSCSALRYAENLVKALTEGEEQGAIVGVDVFGPMAEQATQPGLFWYGIHCVEVMQRVLGNGCREVHAVKNADGEVVTCVYGDGRMGVIRGVRKGHSKFGAIIHREKGFQYVDISGGKRSYYAGMLEAVMKSLPIGRSDIRAEETLEVIAIIEAANQARGSGAVAKVK